MKIKGSKNSHIQIPKLLLKGFSSSIFKKNEMGKNEKPRMVYKLDMDGNVTQVNIKDVNTEYGYYEDIIETEMLTSIEIKFGELKTKIMESLKNNKDARLFDENDIIIVKKFCSLCWMRSPSIVSEITKKSLFINLYKNAPQNVVMYQYFKSPRTTDKYIIGNNLSYVKNETNINYILPQLYVIALRRNNIYDYFIPITPKLLIRLTTEKTLNENIFYIGNMTETDVDNLNKWAITFEYKHNHKAIYAKNKEDLERYVDFIKNLKK